MTRIKRPKKIGYKIIYPLGYSKTSGYRNGRIIEYKEGKRVYKYITDGPLAVFSNYERASEFCLLDFYRKEIWKCEYRESISRQLWYNFERNEPSLTHYMEDWIPFGTKFADSVKLLERAY